MDKGKSNNLFHHVIFLNFYNLHEFIRREFIRQVFVRIQLFIRLEFTRQVFVSIWFEKHCFQLNWPEAEEWNRNEMVADRKSVV